MPSGTTLQHLLKFGEELSSSEEKMPVLFVGHGSPMNAVEDNEFSEGWKAVGRELPTPEHFLPMLYVLALKDENEQVRFFNDKTVRGPVSMTSFRIS